MDGPTASSPAPPSPKDPRVVLGGLDRSKSSPVVVALLEGMARSSDSVLLEDLRAFLPQANLAGTGGQDPRRSLLALDWLFRTYAPTWLELAGILPEARRLRGLSSLAEATEEGATRETVLQVLEVVQRDAQRASEQLQLALEGEPEGDGAAGEAWNRAMELVERAAKSPSILALEMGAVAAARAAAEETAAAAGWNWLVSACDMAVQSHAWRAAEPQVRAAVAQARRKEDWEGAAAEAKEAASQALAPTTRDLARSLMACAQAMLAPLGP